MNFPRLWIAPLAVLTLAATPAEEPPASQQKQSSTATALAWDARAVEHLLNRAGFGATASDIDAALAMGREAFLAKLFTGFAPDGAAFEVVEPDRPSPAERRAMSEEQRRKFGQELRRQDTRQALEYAGWWVDEMAAARHPLRERMVLFWHGFFTSSAKEVKSGEAMIRQNQLFRQHALGSYADLLHAIVRDPAMLLYLNNNKNTREAPNENLARELMELFSLGEGHYTEEDVKEAARALTGYGARDGKFVFNRRAHDTGTKTILGKSGALDPDGLVEILLAQEACPKWVSSKLLEHFEGRVPSQARVDEYAKFLRANQFSTSAFLKRLFDDPRFYADDVVGQRILGPLEFMVANCRRLDVHPPGAVIAAGASLLGQQVFGPPSVKGWDGGRAWITTSTFLQRGNLAGMLLGVTRAEDIFKEDPALLADEDDAAAMSGEMMDEAMGEEAGAMTDEVQPPAASDAPARGERAKARPQGPRGREGASLRLMEAARWRRELDLRARCRASGAISDQQIVDRLAADLLAVEISPEARAAMLEYVRAERSAKEIPEGQLLEKKGYGESILRQTAHLILSLPEAQLN